MSIRTLALLLAAEIAIAPVALLGLPDPAEADAPAYRAVTLVCPADLPPGDCDRATARDVLNVVAVPTPFACMMGGLQTLARAPELAADGYPKTICERAR